MKTVKIRTEQHSHGQKRAKRLHGLHHVTAGDLLNKFVEKTKTELIEDQGNEQKRASFGFFDPFGLSSQLCLDVGATKVIRKLWPNRKIGGTRKFKNLAGEDAAEHEADLFGEAELSRVFSLHKAGKHYFEEIDVRTNRGRELILRKLVGSIIQAVRYRERSTARPTNNAIAMLNVSKELRCVLAGWSFGVSRCGKNTGVIIRAGDQDLAPRFFVGWH